jgi:two-component sensor histidine kinase
VPGTGLAEIGRRWLWFAQVLGVFTLVSLPFGIQETLSADGGGPGHWWRAVVVAACSWYAWALLTPLIVRLGRCFRFEGRAAWRSVVVHGVASAVLASVQAGLRFLLLLGAEVAFDASSWTARALLDEALPWIVSAALPAPIIYWSILGIWSFIDTSHRLHERELQTSQLQTQLANAQLDVLRMQLNPHFLFNTLNAVTTLMHRDVDAAEQMVVRLGELLRATLESSGVHRVPLRHELATVQRYLEIEKIRFAGRLETRVEIEPEVRDALVPNLILQPLVENSIKHGIRPLAGTGRISIRARRDSGRLAIDVEDNGVGLGSGQDDARSTGVGLLNTRQRLQNLYGSYYDLGVGDAPDGGTLVALRIPLRWPGDEE